MICYLVRHGKDDDSIRGGWSSNPLTNEGICQVNLLSTYFADNPYLNIGCIFTSDITRAKQTADILASNLNVPVIEMPEFREVNNGDLAGMNNDAAIKQFPGMFWNTMDWEQNYPNGESPRQFYERVSNAWHNFKKKLNGIDYNVILVTHGGTINIIRCIEDNVVYTNKENLYPMGNAEMVPVKI